MIEYMDVATGIARMNDRDIQTQLQGKGIMVSRSWITRWRRLNGYKASHINHGGARIRGCNEIARQHEEDVIRLSKMYGGNQGPTGALGLQTIDAGDLQKISRRGIPADATGNLDLRALSQIGTRMRLGTITTIGAGKVGSIGKGGGIKNVKSHRAYKATKGQ